MSKLMGRIGVARQIGAIGAVGVLGMLAVGFLYYVGSEKLTASSTALEQQNAILAKLDDVKIDLLEALRAEKDFLLQRKESILKNHEKALTEFNQDITTLAKLEKPEARAEIEKLAGLISAYDKEFQTVSANAVKVGLNEDSGLHGAMRASVHTIEDAIKDLGDASLETAMLLMRRHEKDFIARLDRKYLDKFNNTAERFQTRLGQSEFPAPLKSQIEEKLAAYRQSFNALATACLEQAESIAQLSTLYAQAEPQLAKLDSDEQTQSLAAKNQVLASARSATQTINWAIGLICFVVAALGWLIGRGVSRPLAKLTIAMGQIAGGDLGAQIPFTERGDEIGAMAGALKVFKDNLATKKAAQRIEQTTREFEQAVGSIVDVVASAAAELSATAEQLSRSAKQTTARSNAVYAASQIASEDVQTVASATEELSCSIREISQQVQQANDIAIQAAAEAEQTTSAVQRLNETTGRIGDIIGVISGIAAQTNMLALNATIEAARAGESGRGFAVVAQEVKALAEQTTKATTEITKQIAEVQESTQQATSSIEIITKTIQSISASASAIASAVEEQGAATQEIAHSANQTSGATSEVAQNITDVKETAEISDQAAQTVLLSSRNLEKQSENLRVQVQNFLTAVRAAA